MKHEFWAEFDLYTEMHQQDIDAFVNQGEGLSPRWQPISDFATRQHILAQLLLMRHKNYARTGANKQIGGLLFWYHGFRTDQGRFEADFRNPRGPFQRFLEQQFQQYIQSILWHKSETPPLPDLSLFPPGSWAIQLTFTLRKPYLSKDDVDFYILDNPVKKEWVFKVPYVAPSQWKGALRAAMRRMRGYTTWEEEAQNEQMVRLFGNVKGDEVDFSAGRLHFYPTFFDRIGLEVINPHPRDTGAGKNPIYFEAVPAGTSGVFTLLYVPLDAGPKDEGTVKADLAVVARGIWAMLTEYGFGAKTSSGYGVAKDEIGDGMVKINLPDVFKASPPTARPSTDYAPPEETFLKYLDELGEVKAAFKGSGEGGLMSNSEYKQQGESRGGGSLSEFKRFRGWYLAHGAAWKAARHTQEPVHSEKPPISQEDFETLSALSELANSLQADAMASQPEGGENG